MRMIRSRQAARTASLAVTMLVASSSVAMATAPEEAAAPEEADAIRNRARAVIGEFYAAGAAGDIELSALIEGHGKILDSWRFDPGFKGEIFWNQAALEDETLKSHRRQRRREIFVCF